MKLELDDELFPARRSLVGLRFANEQDLARAQQLIASDLTLYHELYPGWKMIVVRRDDAERFAAAGLRYTEVEQIDDDELPPEEVARRDRALIDAWKPIVLERLRGNDLQVL
jgi:hypothetical protein